MLFLRSLALTLVVFFLLFTPKTGNSNVKLSSPENSYSLFEAYSDSLYKSINDNDLSLETFRLGLKGYLSLKDRNLLEKTDLLTIVDYSKSCMDKRFYVIDVSQKKIVYKSLVAHGKKSGLIYPCRFSNDPNSNQSCLGFFVTGEKYTGKHGTALRLDGVEVNINDKARERAIVIHAAEYVSDDFIKKNGRLGRSQGCPALPSGISEEVIDLIKDKTCLFIYYPDNNYINQSVFLNNEDFLKNLSNQ